MRIYPYQLIRIIFFLMLGFGVTQSQCQEELNVLKSWFQYDNSDNSLYPHLTNEAYKLLNKRAQKVKKIVELNDWEKRQSKLSHTLSDIIGPFPKRTPLNVEIVRKIEKEDYTIEHIVFQSQPGFYVTASLFIPSSIIKGNKRPAILYCSGHAGEAFRSKAYQHVILNLVKKGFIVFAFDPIGQGERLEYINPKTGEKIIPREHLYISPQLFLNGSFLGMYMIWDGIRAVDYLMTRNEVDTTRIGITGRSGGGFQSAYIAAFDNRIYAVAPENHISNYKRIFQSIGPRHGEHNPDDMFLREIDQADFLAVRSPDPLLLITTSNDIFNIQGAKETFGELQQIYQLYDKVENLEMVEDLGGHTSTKKNREAMYAFFQKHLKNNGNPKDLEVELLTREELQVTHSGQVVTTYQCKTIFDINRSEAKKKILYLDSIRNNVNINIHKTRTLNLAKKVSGFVEPTSIGTPVLTGRSKKAEYRIDKYFINGEGDYPIPFLFLVPKHANNNKSLIYIHPSGKDAFYSNKVTKEEIEILLDQGFNVLIPDMIGTGETGPGAWKGRMNPPYFVNKGLKYEIWYASMVIGRSIVGIRAGDVIRLSKVLKKLTPQNEICAIAKREMSPVLLHAAAFDSTISRVALVAPYISYKSIVMNRNYSPTFIDNAVPSVLGNYDLPDLAACLAPRKLLVANIVGGNGENIDVENVEDELSIIKKAYRLNNANDNLEVIIGNHDYDLAEFLMSE